MSVTQQQVLEALGRVKDPDLSRDIVALGFVKGLQIDERVLKYDNISVIILLE